MNTGKNGQYNEEKLCKSWFATAPFGNLDYFKSQFCNKKMVAKKHGFQGNSNTGPSSP